MCRLRSILFCLATILSAATPLWGGQAGPAVCKGPSELPERLEGPWKVSLCVSSDHAWIRFKHLETGELHTLSRYQRGWGGQWDAEEHRWVAPRVAVSGVQWDRDVDHEEMFDGGRCVFLSVTVRDPKIFRGRGDGLGFNAYFNNCTTFAREAWRYYSGESYWWPGLDLPTALQTIIWNRHTEVRSAEYRRHGP